MLATWALSRQPGTGNATSVVALLAHSTFAGQLKCMAAQQLVTIIMMRTRALEIYHLLDHAGKSRFNTLMPPTQPQHVTARP